MHGEKIEIISEYKNTNCDLVYVSYDTVFSDL